jgi:hypothetical protein
LLPLVEFHTMLWPSVLAAAQHPNPTKRLHSSDAMEGTRKVLLYSLKPDKIPAKNRENFSALCASL